jgi:hypothetical protein
MKKEIHAKEKRRNRPVVFFDSSRWLSIHSKYQGLISVFSNGKVSSNRVPFILGYTAKNQGTTTT